ncbi:hypothetical protein RHMOL_Rhmol09G0049000 [Rhododendron molle]|uniref:Uncharacterized protein n=1 Tax=Rhododendron molle TaxID=49168 RepID=A0ACC0MA29_RHOML|nr:hypothetical protein RHMOL_Rhmol09G0049000 [Rhododendron molle]
MEDGEIVVGEYAKFKGEKELWVQMWFEESGNLNRYSVPASTLRLFMKIIRHFVDLVLSMMGGPLFINLFVKDFCIPGGEVANIRALSTSETGADVLKKL